MFVQLVRRLSSSAVQLAPRLPRTYHGGRHFNSKHVQRMRRLAVLENRPLDPRLDDSVYYGDKRNVQCSVWKLNLVADQIRGLRVYEALKMLEFSKKKAALPLRQLIYDVMDKAQDKVSDPENMYVLEAYVTKGENRVFGMHTANRGRHYRLTTPYSHVFLKLRDGDPIIRKKHQRAILYKLVPATTRIQLQLERSPPKIRNSLE